ncbi:MAG: ABC transporter ATP-binding protein/permease [Lachnospiraceae bacterium]|nr:ABC transporter ATP-binding protein/permease [Lachnospiraceae bacterium]
MLLKDKNVNSINIRFKTRLSMLFYFLKGSKRYFGLSLFFAACVSLLDLFFPRIIAYTVDNVINNLNTGGNRIIIYFASLFGGSLYLRKHLYLVAVMVLIVAILAVLSRYFFKFLNSKGAERFIKRMRDELYEHILKLPMTWHNTNHTGDIIQRCTSDIDTVKNFVSEQLTNFIQVVVMIIIAIAFMATINPALTVVAMILMPVILVYSIVFHNKIAESFYHVDNMEGKLSSIAQENLTGVRVVRAFGRELYEKKRFESMNEEYISTWTRLMRLLSEFWALGDLVTGLQILLIIATGSFFCVRGYMTAGEYIAFIAYNSMLSWPIRMLGRVISDMGKAGISIDRIMYIMNSIVEPPLYTNKLENRSALLAKAATDLSPSEVTEIMKKDIVFDHVSFSYDNETKVLDDISFRAPAGSTTGILGGTGSGKTTLMELLDRIYDLDNSNGRISVGGVDINQIDRSLLRQNIGMVLQEPFLFSGTLRENISISAAYPNNDEIERAVRIASLNKAISEFSNGYETYVGERGVTLSGGQKQRTAIAQMLIRNTPVMIFDDSLSAVDPETDLKIRKALNDLNSPSTKFIISHRISTIMNSDMILVLDKGRIIESGTHKELLENNGRYKRIFDLQRSGGEVLNE